MSSNNSLVVEVHIGKPVCVYMFSEFKLITEILKELVVLYKVNEAESLLRWRFDGDRMIVWEEGR